MKHQEGTERLIQRMVSEKGEDSLLINLQKCRIVIHNRYEWIQILNDGLLALWFLAGSILSFHSSLENLAIWLFIIGGTQMAIRPLIRIAYKFWRREIETQIKYSKYEN